MCFIRSLHNILLLTLHLCLYEVLCSTDVSWLNDLTYNVSMERIPEHLDFELYYVFTMNINDR